MVNRGAEQALASDWNQLISHRQLAVGAVVAKAVFAIS